jgi:hypothetical protein
MHLQALDLLGTRAPSAFVCAERDVITELEKLEPSKTLSQSLQPSFSMGKFFCTPFPVNNSCVLIVPMVQCFF